MEEISAVTLGSQVFPAVPNAGGTQGTIKGKQSFESFLNIGNSATAGNAKDTVQAQQPAADKNAAQPADTVNADTSADNQQPGTDSTSQVQKDGTADTNSSAGNVSQDNTDVENTDAVMAGVDAVNNAVKEAVKDITGLDDEALAEIMAALGMSFADLLDMGNLKQFVMFINNTSDVTDLLMNESVMSQLNNLADVIADIDIEALTGMPENDFAQLLQDIADGRFTDTANSNNSDGAVQEAGMPADKTVTIEFAGEADAQATVSQEETVQYATAGKENMAASKETAVQDNSQQEDAKVVISKEQSGTDNTGQTENFKQGAGSQAGGAMTENVQAEARPSVHEENFNNQAGFIQNLAQAAADVQDGAMPQQANMQTMINIVNQVVEQIKVTMGKEMTNMQLQLNPESLGKVLVSVTSNHGVMTANFTVQSEEAKEALQSQMFALREALESRSLKVDAVEVEVSDFTFSQSSQADSQNQKEFEKGSGRRFKFGFDNEEDGTDSTDTTVSGRQSHSRLDMGSSIDFTA
ncbi:MAG: hypothetical protein HFH68_07115 [Lachnospiraceae bacterium]|nr:hypothetical protein [Lachnospiraceae bacterium]